MSKDTVWVVDDDRSIRWVLEKAFKQADMEVKSYEQADSVLKALNNAQPDAIISDIRMPGMDGLELLSRIHSHYPDLPVIIITAHTDLDAAVSAYQGGAFEYLPKPFDVDEAVELTRRAVKHHREISGEREELVQEETEIIGEAPSMQEVFRAIGRLSRSNITVLINGESGTGKELVAHALHRHSPRADNPFIALNMAAIPRDLLESELFGHEKGAFTGAQSARKGRFEQADGGTLFLDEIGEMPLASQVKLLRVLQEGQIVRVGESRPRSIDVRIIAASNRPLADMVASGQFRQDLYYRLHVVGLTIPPLVERKEDVSDLVTHFIGHFNKRYNRHIVGCDPPAMHRLLSHTWPGNVRELEHAIEHAFVVSAPEQSVITEQALPADLSDTETRPVPLKSDGMTDLNETSTIQAALEQARGNKTQAAQRLGLTRAGLYKKMRRLGL